MIEESWISGFGYADIAAAELKILSPHHGHEAVYAAPNLVVCELWRFLKH